MAATASKIRTFAGGATRDTAEGKYDYEGFLSPLVLERFGQFMNEHRKQSDGNLRDSDNWQKGIPKTEYIKSGLRHTMDWWLNHRGYKARTDDIEEVLCSLMFNVMGYLHETLKEHHDGYHKSLFFCNVAINDVGGRCGLSQGHEGDHSEDGFIEHQPPRNHNLCSYCGNEVSESTFSAGYGRMELYFCGPEHYEAWKSKRYIDTLTAAVEVVKVE